MYKKVFFTLLILCGSLLSCSNPIENNSRIAFDLKVIDQENQPISDIDINVSLFRSSGGISIIFPTPNRFEGLVGVGSTDLQGEITLISLEPTGSIDKIGVIINSDEQFEGTSINENYGVVIYQLDSISERTTVLPETILKRTATLEVEIIDNPDLEGTLQYTITYPTRIQQFQFPEGEESINEIFERSGVPETSEVLAFETLQNTTATFTYFLTSSTGEVETNTIEIPINQETVQYAFEF